MESIINSLKNTIKNIGNPYNFNLWRKLSNIILKNIFVILYKKKYTFSQYPNYSVSNQLNKYKNNFSGKELKEYTEKVNEYDNKLKIQNN